MISSCCKFVAEFVHLRWEWIYQEHLINATLRNNLIDSFVVLCIMVSVHFILPTNNYSVSRGIFSKMCKQNSKRNVPEISPTILNSHILHCSFSLYFRFVQFTFKFRSLRSREPFSRVTTSRRRTRSQLNCLFRYKKKKKKKKKKENVYTDKRTYPRILIVRLYNVRN